MEGLLDFLFGLLDDRLWDLRVPEERDEERDERDDLLELLCLRILLKTEECIMPQLLPAPHIPFLSYPHRRG